MLATDYIPRAELTLRGGLDVAEERINTGMRLLPSTVDAIDQAGERMGGKSRAFVVEVLVALYARGLTADTKIPVGMVPQDSRAKRTPKPAGKKPKT